MEYGKTRLTPAAAKQKIYRYCAYQERSHHEVRNKLYEYGLYTSDVDEIMSHLITEGFLNEERFAKAFAGGKFRMQHWGRVKIVHEMEAHGLSKYCIKSGLKEIDDEDYDRVLQDILEKKLTQLDITNPFVARDKLARYAIQKGFEPDLVWPKVKGLVPV